MQPGRIAMRTQAIISAMGLPPCLQLLDVAIRKVIGSCMDRHRSKEYISFLNQQIDKSVPSNLDVHLILDNYSTHKTPSVKRWLTKHLRFHQHFTPGRSVRE